jgi:hypothetical protein
VTLLGYAAQAVSRGFYVFPCNPAGTMCPETGRPLEKVSHLLRPNRPFTMKWGDAATNDMRQVVNWWTQSPNANIGIAAKPSGVIVVDCDMPKQAYQLKDTPWGYLHEKLGPLVDGADVLREMSTRFGDDYSRLERTYRVCTASMGLHLYFRWPEGVQASQASPVPGLLDIRCNGGVKGGYVLGAGSATAKGHYLAENELPIADAPDWLVELCREKPKAARVKPLFSTAAGGGYSGLRDAVRFAQEGNRNNVLLWAARSMCEDGASQEECEEVLGPAGVEAGQAERDVLATIRSAYRLQGAK